MPKSIKKSLIETTSTAYSRSGKVFKSGSFISNTNSLQISSELGALVLSALNRDYRVEKIITTVDAEDSFNISPIILKLLVDHSIRTHLPIEYIVQNKKRKILFQTKDPATLLPFYKPAEITIKRFAKARPAPNFLKTKITTPLQLKKYALKGLERNFPSYDSASSYGTALTTGSGKVYFGGQYSSPDKSLSVHSEMTAILSALSAGEKSIAEIGIVSSKFPDSPCNMCGICRQFIAETASKLGISPVIYCFSEKTDDYKTHSLEEYLPSLWTTKNRNSP